MHPKFIREELLSALELEFLALKWAISESFSNYLYSALLFAHTDDKPLTCPHYNKKRYVHRRVELLADYNFIIHYNPGGKKYT